MSFSSLLSDSYNALMCKNIKKIQGEPAFDIFSKITG